MAAACRTGAAWKPDFQKCCAGAAQCGKRCFALQGAVRLNGRGLRRPEAGWFRRYGDGPVPCGIRKTTGGRMCLRNNSGRRGARCADCCS